MLISVNFLNAPFPGPNILQYTANSAISKESISKRIDLLHTCKNYPAISTFCNVIEKMLFTNWPELTATSVRKYEPKSVPMINGHLYQQRQNIRSTNPKIKPKTEKPIIFQGTPENPVDTQPDYKYKCLAMLYQLSTYFSPDIL